MRHGTGMRLAAMVAAGLTLGAGTGDAMAAKPVKGSKAGATEPAPDPLDSTTLAARLEAGGFQAPPGFKALVVELDPGRVGRFRARAYDWHGTSEDRGDWWPASTVKLFAVAAALERVQAWGFTPAAQVTFQYPAGDEKHLVADLVRDALVPSSNTAFDQLVEIAGFDWLNGVWLPRRGFHTVLLRGYSGRQRDPDTKMGSLRDAPALVVEEDGRRREVRLRKGRGTYDCPNQGNCTTLAELADALLRLVLPGALGPRHWFALKQRDIEMVRGALGEVREAGEELGVGLREAFADGRRVVVHHKPGFAAEWASDVAFLKDPGSDRRWVVAVAAQPGREALVEAGRAIGKILAGGGIGPQPLPPPVRKRPVPRPSGSPR